MCYNAVMSNDAALTTEKLKALPQDVLISLYLQMQSNLFSLQQNQEKLISQNEQLIKQVENMKEAILLAQQNRFGRKTEKAIDGQITLSDLSPDFTDVLNEAEKTVEGGMPEEPEFEEVTFKRRRKKGVRDLDLSGLEVRVIPHEIPEEELKKLFPKGYTRLEDERYRELEFIPAQFKVNEHHIAVYADKGSDRIIKAERPARLLPGSLVTPTLASSIINAKYANGIPLERLSQDFAARDVKLRRQTMARWMIKLNEGYFSVIYDLMRKELFKAKVIHSDETPFVVNETNKALDRKPGTKSYMWVYYTKEKYGSHPICLYDHCVSRRADHPEEFLKDYTGTLVTDGYQVYHKIEDDSGGSIKIAGCWAHAKRRFSNLCKALGKKVAGGTIAEEGEKRIRAIYHVDNMTKDASPEERLKNRQDSVKPLVDAYFVWAKEKYALIDKASKTGEALSYSINQEKYLRAFLDDPMIPLDNNDAEREGIRPFTIGRKNWVIVDSERGAEAGAVIYSLVRTAIMNNLKPAQYIQYILEKMPERMSEPASQTGFEDLLPWSAEAKAACEKLIK